MFNPHTTYPVDGVPLAPGVPQSLHGTPNGSTYALVGAHRAEASGPPLGTVVEVTNINDHVLRAASNGYGYRYFRGPTLNTHTEAGNPVMLLGPLDSDLPWVVGTVLDRQEGREVTVAPLWGPIGADLSRRAMRGDAWVRIAATPPGHVLWHPEDSTEQQEAKQAARNVWLRWQVAWLALLGETSMRGWREAMEEIASRVDYSPDPIAWDVLANAEIIVPLHSRLDEAARTRLRHEYGEDYLPDGADLGAAALFTTPLRMTVRSELPPDVNDERMRVGLTQQAERKFPTSRLGTLSSLSLSPSTL